MQSGTFGAVEISSLVEQGHIRADAGIEAGQIQPSSLDLVLSAEGFRMPGSTLLQPGERVADLIRALALEPISLAKPTCLARGATYWVRLRERLRLPAGVEGYTNNKSSTGRIDLATRVLCDGSQRYDRINAGYQGDLWLEISPRSFDVIVCSGLSLNQAIFFHGRQILDQRALWLEHANLPLLYDPDGTPLPGASAIVDGRVVMRADLSHDIVGYVSVRSLQPLDCTRLRHHEAEAYFRPIPRPRRGFLCLERDRFYILATRERVLVPADMACEMVPYDPAAGEFRAHYAGFFDPGWGMHPQGPQGTCAVLEVRPHEDDLILRDGQPICAMAYERLTSPCTQLYGSRGNHYATQSGPQLSKFFR